MYLRITIITLKQTKNKTKYYVNKRGFTFVKQEIFVFLQLLYVGFVIKEKVYLNQYSTSSVYFNEIYLNTTKIYSKQLKHNFNTFMIKFSIE